MMNRMPNMPSAPKQNPLHASFKNPHFPANFIHEANALEYFCNPDNMFYDMKSCNQIIKMQQIIDRPLEECLQSMAGDQYVLHSARPPLFVIMKQHRTLGPNQNVVTPLAYYYIINGTVYQSPDAFSLVQSRLLGAVAPLGLAFDQMLKFSRFNVAKGYSWEFDKKPAGEGDEEEEEEEDAALLNAPSTSTKKKADDETAHTVARSSAFQEQRTTNIMQLLFEQFPPLEAKAGSGDAAAAAAGVGGDAAEQAASAAGSAAAAAGSGIAAMLPPGDDTGREDQPPTKRGK